MARKKSSLATTPRRATALRAAPVGLAAASSRRLVAPPTLPSVNALVRPSESDAARDAIESKLYQLVSPHSRVLVIGRDTWPLSRSLSTAGCRVSVVETRHDAPAGSATFADRVIVGDPDTLNLSDALDGARFDTVIAVRLLEHVRDPVATLTAIGKHLAADAAVIAAVPNVMHGRIRLEFLAGRSPAAFLPPDAASPSHWYDGAALHRTFESARFAITRIERHVEAFDAGALPIGSPLPAALVDDLTRDADAMTRTFMVVAHPFPLGRNVRFEIRIRELTELHDRTAEQVRALEQRTEDLGCRYTELARRIEGIAADMKNVATRDSGLQPALTAAHQQLTSHRAGIETIHRDLRRFQYEQLIPRVRTMVEASLPPGAVALVVSKGDERLLTFDGRTGWHFLRSEKGEYAGHHPADSAAAIKAIERLRKEGAGYLVIPQVALWWLDHYAGLREHLDKRARVVARHDRTAVIYALDRSEARR